MIFSYILAIVLFLLMMIFHELGHMLVAKSFNCKVEEYSIGMGPLLWTKQGKETQYSLRAVPLGAYCKLEGEDEDLDDPRSFSKLPAVKKIAVLVAGGLINIVCGFLLVVLAYFILTHSVPLALKNAVYVTGEFFVSMKDFFVMLFAGKVGSDDVVSIVGIAGIVGETAKYGIENVIYLMGIVSMNLGLINLLPVPALDGGRILLTVLRGIFKGKISDNAEAIVNGIGLILLLALSVLLIFKDTINLFR